MERKIYNLNSGTIEIYSYLPDQVEQMKYRREQLELIPYSQRVLVEKEPVWWFTNIKDVVYSCPAFSLRKGETPGTKMKESMKNDELLRRYHRGDYMECPAFDRISRAGREVFYLDPEDGTNKRIQLTGGLYIQYLIYNGMFTDENLDTDLSRFARMFKISPEPISVITEDELNRNLNSGLVTGDHDQIMEFVDASSQVYRKIR